MAVVVWQRNIKEYQAWDRKLGAVGKFARSFELGNAFLGITSHDQRVGDFRPTKGQLRQQHIVIAILNEENDFLVGPNGTHSSRQHEPSLGEK